MKDYYQVIYEDDSKARFHGKIIDIPGKVIKAQKKLTQEELKKIPELDQENNIIMVDKVVNNEQKEAVLKKIRNHLLGSTVWIQARHTGEEYGLEKGWTSKQPTLTDLKYKEWLLYWEALRDLPETVDYSKIDIQEIKANNNDIFPVMPEIIEYIPT